ncbi:2-oxoacid ferredoxin oxidoreductase [Candidatus Thorarchaeota archaeon]|nr:MAG: 2-oxoacid ferredoxin oxidoreductase [Candidatus Thorarchaeota archaeon]
MVEMNDLGPPTEIQWCPGCGNFGILRALKKALVNLGQPAHNIFLVSGIGQSGKTPHFIDLNGFHTLHGRAVPIATGAAVSNPNLHVIVHGGDGDLLGEGLGHLLHGARRNVDIAVLIHNNGIYGLTKGQYSPTTPHGQVTKTSPPPSGVPMEPVNPLAQAIVGGATFVARSFAGDIDHLTDIILKAVKHEGFAVVEILQPCVVFNKVWTWDFFNERVYQISDDEHDSSNKAKAIQLAFEWGDRIPLGIFYAEQRRTLQRDLYLPEDGGLYNHQSNLEELQDIIDDMLI